MQSVSVAFVLVGWGLAVMHTHTKTCMHTHTNTYTHTHTHTHIHAWTHTNNLYENFNLKQYLAGQGSLSVPF